MKGSYDLIERYIFLIQYELGYVFCKCSVFFAIILIVSNELIFILPFFRYIRVASISMESCIYLRGFEQKIDRNC